MRLLPYCLSRFTVHVGLIKKEFQTDPLPRKLLTSYAQCDSLESRIRPLEFD